MKKKDIIKSIIVEFHSNELPLIIERKISLPINSNKIISVVGARRVGKTYLLFKTIKNLIEKNIDKQRCLYFNFEDERLDLTRYDLDLILQAYRELYPEIELKKIYIFFDEIQNINGWEKFVRRVYDTVTKNIFITGSNSKLLGDEISTSLRGRTLKYEVSPLSFEEFLKFKNFEFNSKIDFYNSKKKVLLLKYFEEFLKYGGFPEIPLMEQNLKVKTLQEYFNVLIYRDIIERYKIKDVFVLKYFIKRLAENVSKTFSVNKIYNELKSQGIKIGKNSLYNYIEFMETCFLIKLVKKHYSSILKSEMGEKKIYFVDNGLINAIRAFDSKNFGGLLENLIWRELSLKFEKIIFYKGKKECDFVVDDTFPIQVCYDFTDTNTKKRELNGLIECCKYFNFKKGFIITFDDEDYLKKESIEIQVLPAYKFLLNIPVIV